MYMYSYWIVVAVCIMQMLSKQQYIYFMFASIKHMWSA